MDKALRVVHAGCGGMSHCWLSAGKEIGLEFVGLVDLNEEAARKRAEEFGFSQAVIGQDLKSVLDKTSPDIVFDCTIPDAHFSVTTEALRHGCHVLGEKPMASSLDSARKMIEAARAAGKIYAVIQNYRYHPGIRRLGNLIQSGKIGTLTTLNSDFYVGVHFGGFRDRMKHVLILDMAIHTFDAARFMAGADPVSVFCKEFNPAGSWYDHDASAVAIFQFSNGVVFTYRGSWCAEGLKTSWQSEWRIVGTEGSVKWNGEEAYQAEHVVGRGEFFSKVEPIEIPEFANKDKLNGHASLIKEFVHCVRTGSVPETVCTDNIKSLAMVFAAIESTETGKPVDIKW